MPSKPTNFKNADFTGKVLNTGPEPDEEWGEGKGLEFHEHANTDLEELERLVDEEAAGIRPVEHADADDEGESLEEAEDRVVDEVEKGYQAIDDDDDDTDGREYLEGQRSEPDEEEGESVEAAEDDEGVPAADEPTEAPTIEDRVSALANQLQRLELEKEKALADAEVWRARSDQHAGRYGNILKQLEDMKRGPSQTTQQYEDGGNGDIESRVRQAIQSEVAPFREELQGRDNVTAMQSAEAEFLNDTDVVSFLTEVKEQGKELADAFTQDFNAALQPYGDDLRDIAKTGSARTAANVTRSAYRSAFADARIKHLSRLSTAAKQVRSEQDAQRKAAKRAVKPTSRAKATAKQPAKATSKQDPRTMDLDELESQLDEFYGVSRGAGTERI